jgi:hypothetical protein
MSDAHAEGGPLPDGVERDFLVRLPADRAPQRRGVVGVNPSVVPSAAYRHIKLLEVNELGAAQRINVDDNPVNRGALGGV